MKPSQTSLKYLAALRRPLALQLTKQPRQLLEIITPLPQCAAPSQPSWIKRPWRKSQHPSSSWCFQQPTVSAGRRGGTQWMGPRIVLSFSWLHLTEPIPSIQSLQESRRGHMWAECQAPTGTELKQLAQVLRYPSSVLGQNSARWRRSWGEKRWAVV